MPVLRYWDQTQGAYVALSGLGAQGPQGTSSLLASAIYAPGTIASYTLTTSLAVIDTNNISISFRAPPSGQVLAEATFMARITIPQTVSEAWLMFNFVTHGSNTAVGNNQRFLDFISPSGITSAQQISATVFLRVRVTGLVSGQTYWWDLAGFTVGTGATGNVYVDTGGSPNYAGAALLVVWAA